jgi:hypothetical protein
VTVGWFEHGQQVSLLHRLAGLDVDLVDHARAGGHDLVLHLHGLEHQDGLAVMDRLAGGAHDLEHRGGERSEELIV